MLVILVEFVPSYTCRQHLIVFQRQHLLVFFFELCCLHISEVHLLQQNQRVREEDGGDAGAQEAGVGPASLPRSNI
jgi:hypothetical protein